MAWQYIYLSHILDNNTPTYGNEYNIDIELIHDMKKGAVANESHIAATTHMGTHIDLPYHFFPEGQCIEAYDASFWIFLHPLIVELDTDEEVINDTLIHELEKHSHAKDIDLLMVRTGMEKYRGTEKYWAANPGFHPKLYSYLIKTFPKLRAFGFDSISLSAYQHPLTGRKAHQAFLNPEHPLIVVEDMHLDSISEETVFGKVIISPLRIAECDGMPCTVIAQIEI